MTKTRKSLDNSLAHAFVYGEDQTVTSPKDSLPQADPASTQEVTPHKEDLVTRLQSSPKEPTIRFTADLPESIHRKLSILAARTGKKKVEIVRMLLIEALEGVET